ncbi:CENP-A-nucleosome distal centromere subunit CENP-L [Penicillium capsulatum]|uniref:CENP-A-nucleosome distal centromere subunit CENP-L n=1 Tax=Penicillium capsulatum TaxID=69766 RepID=A0A9W9HQA7_9EURO|nr:CENP-A-nucleosome distal centromere subunit CENP-L [Penicillium capsulatum]KAJ6106156.1 CENP-A-nucleosome distal centromere subunit CENP-L [Penicillium capsulatum]
MEQASSWQLFNTSWNLHRLSPLHHAKDCSSLVDNPTALKLYATRLRDHLTGDILAGLHAASAADDDALSKTGALKECTWQSITGSNSRDSPAGRRATAASFPGILVTLEYENISYKAALLAELEPSTRSDSQAQGSTFLPLLMTKLPTALRQTFISFLSSNFDTYCAPLHLPSPFLCKGLETFIDELRHAPGSDDDTIEEVVKELQLTLAFSALIAPSLRTVNIGISRNSLVGFLDDDSDSDRSDSRTLEQKLKSPLIANLTSYLEAHLAMSLDLDGSSQNPVPQQHVRLSKLACAAFVLGGEGRLKLVVDARQAEDDQTLMAHNEASLHAIQSLLRIIIRKAVIGGEAT